VLCPNTTLSAAQHCAERVRAAVAPTCHVRRKKPPVTVSLGVAEFRAGSEEDPEALYGRADEKLYEAKDSGRNRVLLLNEPREPTPSQTTESPTAKPRPSADHRPIQAESVTATLLAPSADPARFK